jgi:HK97 family phage prohead protease
VTDKLTYLRAFPSDIQRSGPRQLTGRLVPYGVVADVLDELPGGQIDIYKEGFRFGAFGPQVNTRERGVFAKIGLIHRHDGGLGYLGPFADLQEQDDGLYGNVSVLRSKADDVEDLLAAGVGELSVEFRLAKANHTEIDDDGVRWRTRAHLDQVALEPRGAYTTARVLAYRAEIDAQQAEQSEVDTKAEADAARQAELEAQVQASEDRRRRWDELTTRLDSEKERQDQLIKQYGFTQPGGNWS